MFKRINIAIIPSKEVEEYVNALSKQISDQTDTFFVLDSKNFYPHITLFAPEFPDGNYNEVINEVERIASGFAPFIVSSLNFQTHDGYIDIALKKSPELSKLHETIVHKINPFRENHLRDKYKDPEVVNKFTQVEQKI